MRGFIIGHAAVVMFVSLVAAVASGDPVWLVGGGLYCLAIALIEGRAA